MAWFGKEFENFNEDKFDGSFKEREIFREVLFNNDKSVNSKKTCRIVESSNHGITSSIVSLNQNVKTEDISSNSSNKAMIYPSISIPNKSKIQPKLRWKNTCFLELDESELTTVKDSTNDPRPLLRYHVHQLLTASGWVVGRRKRAGKLNGIGEYIFKSPEGRPIREFRNAWISCGSHLLSQVNDVIQQSNETKSWTELTQFRSDLYNTVTQIEEQIHNLKPSLALASTWCLLDPFANVVFIDKTIRFLKEGKLVEAKRTLVDNSQTCLSSDDSSNQSGPHEENNFLSQKSIIKDIKRVKITETPPRKAKKPKICRLKDDDLLISAIIKNKSYKSTKKRKNNCRLLLRSKVFETKWSIIRARTVLSWLINSGVISVNEVIHYRDPKNESVVKEGLITWEGVLCLCCNNTISLSDFKVHSGFVLNRPCLNLFMESGESFTLCMLEAWSIEYQTRKGINGNNKIEEIDSNDDSCGRCGDFGELICCDNCPQTFHQSCLHVQELPEGNWYCPHCTCGICKKVAIKDSEYVKKCSQCEHQYHLACVTENTKYNSCSDTWFCGKNCLKIYSGLQSRIGVMNYSKEGYAWTLLKCIHGDQKVHSAPRLVALKGECNSKLAVALTIMEECFLPMVDPRTRIDMIPHVVYSWGSQFTRLNYKGFYTMVLEKDDIVTCVASIRIHGVRVAEMPLIATCSKYRRQGMCRRLMNAIEEMLKCFKVEKLVVSAIPSLVETWTKGFGFTHLKDEEKQRLGDIDLMFFPESVWLTKSICEEGSTSEESQQENEDDQILE